MNMTHSQQLLAEYVRGESESAFRELVSRYVDLVHSTALRLVEGDLHRAQDVTQTVFIDLARMAKSLSKQVMLGGWLHRHTCYVAVNLMRGERRRQWRERQAVEMNALPDNSQDPFGQMAPLLDEAINELGNADRMAILLRFFEQQDFRSVAEALGSNEDAARMRVNRALDNPNKEIQGNACYTLAKLLKDEAKYGHNLMATAQAEIYFERMIREFGQLKERGFTFEYLAKPDLSELRLLGPGKPAPEIEANDLNGQPLKWSDFRGAVVVLIFWTGSYGDVREYLSLLESMAGKPFAFLTVVPEYARTRAKESIEKHGIPWRCFLDEGEGAIHKKWNVKGWPSLWIIDREGVIRWRNARGRELADAINQLL